MMNGGCIVGYRRDEGQLEAYLPTRHVLVAGRLSFLLTEIPKSLQIMNSSSDPTPANTQAPPRVISSPAAARGGKTHASSPVLPLCSGCGVYSARSEKRVEKEVWVSRCANRERRAVTCGPVG